jgi:hypothetical protein
MTADDFALWGAQVDPPPPACPRCDGPMGRETASQGVTHICMRCPIEIPPNPTQCPLVMHEGAWRVWCEADVAGPCRGCPEAGEAS